MDRLYAAVDKGKYLVLAIGEIPEASHDLSRRPGRDNDGLPG